MSYQGSSVSKSPTRKVRSKKAPQLKFGCRKAQLCGLGEEALNSIRRALETETDGRMAIELLTAIGVIPDRKSGAQRASVFGTGVLECPLSKANRTD